MALVIKRLGGPRAASALVGVTEDSLSNWRDGRVNPSFHGIRTLAMAAGVSLDWLAFGEGPERREDTDNHLSIPCINPAFLAGGSLADLLAADPPAVVLPRRWARDVLGLASDKLVLLTASGDTMTPTIGTGDLLLVDTGVTEFAEEGIYLVGMGSTVGLKRVQMAPGGGVTLKNDNRAYGDQHLAPDDLDGVRVFGIVRRVSRPQ